MLIALAIVASFCIAPIAYAVSYEDTMGESYTGTILGDFAISQTKANEISEKVVEISSLDSFAAVGANNIIAVSSSLSDSVDAAEYRATLMTYIENGTPVISLEGEAAFTEAEFDLPTAFMAGATATGYYCDPLTGAVCCYSVKCSEQTEANNRVYAWADNMLNKSVAVKEDIALAAATGNSPSWGSEIQSYADFECGDYGWFYMRTNYYEQITNSTTYRYYMPEYSLQAVPNSNTNARICDMNVQCDVDKFRNTQKLLDYAPTTTSGTSTATVGLNWNVSASGGSIGMSYERSYAISDIMVHDYSSFGENLFTTSHDIQESGTVGDTTILIKPGLVASSEKSNSNGNYIVEDNYSVNFCKYQKTGSWPWSPWACQDHHLFYTTLNINIP